MRRLYFDWLTRRSTKLLSSARTADELLAEVRHTSKNVGNLVHLEAVPKLLRYDPVSEGPLSFDDMGIERFREKVDETYEGIVFQYANAIRGFDNKGPEEHARWMESFRRAATWIRSTKRKVFAFGLGIQNKLEPRPDAVAPELFDWLSALNERAELFAVRGKATEEWLHSVGLTKAVALGCPSLFVYPANTSQIKVPTIDKTTRVATAGHIHGRTIGARLGAIDRIGQSFPAYYVLQNDFFPLLARLQDRPVYNEASGEVDAAAVRAATKQRFGTELSFEKYYMFRSVEKWRGFTAAADLFFGDRFHGGVVFLQCGRPAVLVRNDERVGELADFFAIPSVRTKDLMEGDPIKLLRSALSEQNMERFRTTYLQRAAAFRSAVQNVGLELANSDAFAEALGEKPPVTTPPRAERAASRKAREEAAELQ